MRCCDVDGREDRAETKWFRGGAGKRAEIYLRTGHNKLPVSLDVNSSHALAAERLIIAAS